MSPKTAPPPLCGIWPRKSLIVGFARLFPPRPVKISFHCQSSDKWTPARPKYVLNCKSHYPNKFFKIWEYIYGCSVETKAFTSLSHSFCQYPSELSPPCLIAFRFFVSTGNSFLGNGMKIGVGYFRNRYGYFNITTINRKNRQHLPAPL